MSRRHTSRRSPSIEALRALLALHEEGSVRAAARKLAQAQSVVSRKLEVFLTADACGAILLSRSQEALRLTAAGTVALPGIRELVQRYDQLLSFLRGSRTAFEVVRIAAGSFAARHYIPPALAILRDSRESLEVETRVVRGEERIVGILERRYDLAIVSHHPETIGEIAVNIGRNRDEMSIELLADLPMAVIARRTTSEAEELEKIPQRRTVPIQKLRRWNLVGLDSRSGIRRQLEQHFRRPNGLHFLAEGGGWAAAREFVRYGIGVGIVPFATLSATDREDLVVRRLSDDFRTAYYLLSRQEPSAPAQEAVKQGLRTAAQTCQRDVESRWMEIRLGTTRTAPSRIQG